MDRTLIASTWPKLRSLVECARLASEELS